MLSLYMDKEIQIEVLVFSMQAITDWEISYSFYAFVCVCVGGVIIHSIYIFSLNWNVMYARILLCCWATFLCQFIMFGAYIFMSLSNMGFVYWLTISPKKKTSHQGQKSENKQTSKIPLCFLASPSHLWAVIFFSLPFSVSPRHSLSTHLARQFSLREL